MEWSTAGWRGVFEKWIIASSGTAWALYWLSREKRREEWHRRPSGLQLSRMKAGVIVTRHSPLCIVRESPAPHNATTPQCSAVPRPPALNTYFAPSPSPSQRVCRESHSNRIQSSRSLILESTRATSARPQCNEVMERERERSPTLPPLYPTTSDLNDVRSLVEYLTILILIPTLLDIRS